MVRVSGLPPSSGPQNCARAAACSDGDAPAMVPLPLSTPALTCTAPVPVPDPLRLLTTSLPPSIVVPPV